MKINHIALATALCCGAAHGQSVNIDFENTAGAPSSDYAAAGLAGVWNALTPTAGVPDGVVNVLGNPVAATVTLNIAQPFAFDDAGTAGNDERLLDDGVGFMGDVLFTVAFDGLMPGTYELFTYGWTPGLPGDSTLVLIDEELLDGLIAGGPWPGKLAEGVTHVVHDVDVIDGTLTVGIVGGYWGASGFLNGMQLVRHTPADLDHDGVVTITDFLALLAAWGICPAGQSCPADLDGTGSVGIGDFLMLLADWG